MEFSLKMNCNSVAFCWVGALKKTQNI